MKKLAAAIALFAIIFTLNTHAQGWRNHEMQVRVEINDAYTAEILAELKLQGDYAPGYAILYIIPREADLLNNAGIRFEVQVDDLNLHYKDFWQTRETYHSYQEIVDLADSLASEFPGICQKVMYGTSIEGRELAALKISDNVSIDENEAEVLFDGGIHGDEIGGPENCIRFARDLCVNYGSDPDVSFLVDNREIWIYYMVNPDGRENMVRYNSNGVDCNRDYGYMWDAWGGSPGAFSQVETKSLRNCSFENQFVVHSTYHSGTEYISCPWSYRSDTPADMDHILQLAEVYSDLSGYSFLEFGQGNSGMYAINGSTKDGNYGIMGSISWSIEISSSKQPPASQIMQYYNWNYPSMMALIEYSGYGLEGIVTDAVTGDPVQATIFINDYMQCFSDETVGDYHKYVLPGKYAIKVVANGYDTQLTTDSIEVTGLNSTITNFQLQPVDTPRWYAWRMISSQIPDNNTADEGNTLALIGPPDGINYSIGKSGWVVVDMQKEITDMPGNDIIVYEGDFTQEGYSFFAGESMDGPWHLMGEGLGTSEFELSVTGLTEARYFKVLDDGDGVQTADNAGFDLDAVSDLEHIWGVFLVMYDYWLEDENGNGHLEQGETSDLVVNIGNNGNVTANNVTATLSTGSPYISITQPTASFGTLLQNQSAEGTFSFEVDENIPNGDTVFFNVDVIANSGIYTNSFSMYFIVGKYPILIIDLDGNHNSGSIMQDIIADIDLTAHYETTFVENLDLYKCVFICLGTYSENHVLSTSEGQALADYLNHGGRLYMEGGDTWAYDPETPVHAMFKINGLDDGNSDLGIIMGQDGSFAAGMAYPYNGDNSYIDHIAPVDNAFELFRNQVPSYCNAVALDNGSYKTVGCSFEFGGLANNAQNTKEELMILILEFFGDIITVTDELSEGSATEIIAWPNPFREKINFSFTLENPGMVKLQVRNINGQIVHEKTHAGLQAGLQAISWDGCSDEGFPLSAGMYIYVIDFEGSKSSGKILLSN